MNRILSSRSHWLPTLIACVGVLVAFVLVAVPARRAGNTLGDPSVVTGYALFALVLFLAAFNLRKKLPMLPLIRARWWTLLHVAGGVLAAALYFLHTGSLWPSGPYEQALALLFYVVSLSGVKGYVIERLYPRRLTGSGIEVIYERIPAELAALREQAEDIVLSCTRETKSDTLSRYYVETFDWFFRSPRFLLSHLTGAQSDQFWREQQFENSTRYLNENEQKYLAELERLAETKSRIDFHYAAQRLMKLWLLVHVPAASALLIVMFWHLLLVNVYAL